jgi:hypothetical protein
MQRTTRSALTKVPILAVLGCFALGAGPTSPARAGDGVDAAVGLAITIPLGEGIAEEPALGMLGNVEGGREDGPGLVDEPAMIGDPELDAAEQLPNLAGPEPVEAEVTLQPQPAPEPVQRAVGDAPAEGALLYLPPDVAQGALGGEEASATP